MSDSFVDLLLVRLGKEEEKKKVLKLLLANLDLSVTEAENAVNNSPSVIKEALPMNEARIIQKDLYPYIDLLPRLEDEAPVNTEEEELPQEESSRETIGADTGEELNEADTGEELNEADTDEELNEADTGEELNEADTGEELHEADIKIDNTEDQPITDSEIGKYTQIEDDNEPIETTSASEEILSTHRCHICGRTPTDGEKLAPCRTCTELTCRDCFDRTAHVCNHCAKDGKSIDRANEGIESEYEEGLEFDSEDHSDDNDGRKSRVMIIVPVILFILALAAVFYFLDPMGLFSTEQIDTAIISTDTTEVAAEDSTGIDNTQPADSLDVLGMQDDTTIAPIDTLLMDDPFAVRLATLPASCIPDENSPAIGFQTTAPRVVDADIPSETSEIIFSQMEQIANSIPVVIDDGVFLVYGDTTSVLILVLLHPEEAGVRIRLMRDVAAWLIPTEIDQLVLIYRENRYQDAILFSLVKEAFPNVEGILSPRQFQSVLSYREDCWESISDPVTQWLSTME